MTETGGAEGTNDDSGESGERFDLAERISMEPSAIEAPEAPSVRTFEEYTADDQLDGAIQEVHPDLLRLFVASVVALNLALLAVSLGVMLWYFEGMLQVGGALVLVGALAGFRTYQYYREYDARDWSENGDAAESDQAGANSNGADSTASAPTDEEVTKS